MRKRRGFVPGAMSRLEERLVLSPGLAAEVGPSVAVMPRVQLDLRGTVTGVESRDPSAADRLRLSGRGEVAPLGQVQASGTLTIRSGEPTIYDGQLALVARKGHVFVHIYGIVGGPSRLHSVHLRYDITGGTGQYRGATGHGAVTYDRIPPEPLPFPPGPGRPYPQVMFGLKFGNVRGPEA